MEKVDCEEVLKQLQAQVHISSKILEYYIALSSVVYRNLYDIMEKGKLDKTLIEDILYTAWRKQIDSIVEEIFDTLDSISRLLVYKLYNAEFCYVQNGHTYVTYNINKVVQYLEKRNLLSAMKHTHRNQNNEQAHEQ